MLSPVIIVVVIARYVAQSIHTLGIFETIIDWKALPYLQHEDLKRYYEAVQVKGKHTLFIHTLSHNAPPPFPAHILACCFPTDIMSEPPLETLGPQERVGDLVELLATSKHNGFPVVESGTRRFLGLVRRVQIAALIECGVFAEEREIQSQDELAAAKYGIHVSGHGVNNESTPLMHWAYLINDDRYDHIMKIPSEENPNESYVMSTLSIRDESTVNNSDEDRIDEFADYHAHSLLTEEQLEVNKAIRMSLRPPSMRGSSTSSFSSSLSEIPQEFATITRNVRGHVSVSWYNHEFESHWVDLAAAANRGTYTVTEFCPVSKAYKLCEFI